MKKSYIESYNIYTYISFPIVPNTKYTVKEEFSPSEKHSRLNEITKSSQLREGVEEFQNLYSKSVHPSGDLIRLGDIVTGLSYFNTLARETAANNQ